MPVNGARVGSCRVLSPGAVPVSTAGDARRAAVVLRLLLAQVQAGRLDAPVGLVRRVEGALAALEAVSRRGVR